MKQKLSKRKQFDIAFNLAARHFTGKVDRGGHSILEHLIRVTARLSTIDEKIVALLHEIFEDTDLTRSDLLAYGIEGYLIDAIESLTRAKGESRIEVARRTKKNVIGRSVKIADVLENMDITRLKKITVKDLDRLAEYVQVHKLLTGTNEENT